MLEIEENRRYYRMFLKFQSQDQRRKYGGSCFIELQFCKLPSGTKIDRIINGYDHWQNESLYVYDNEQGAFYQKYKDIIGFGIHHNMSEGYFDTWGVTYFGPDKIEDIESRLKEHKPEEYEILLSWFEEAKQYNGFYILGV